MCHDTFSTICGNHQEELRNYGVAIFSEESKKRVAVTRYIRSLHFNILFRKYEKIKKEFVLNL